MTRSKLSTAKISVMEVEKFLKSPPAGFWVQTVGSGSGCRVYSDPQDSLVLIDDFHSCSQGTVAFHNSLGRNVKMSNLWEYTHVRKSLLSKRIYLLMSACQENPSPTNKKAAKELKVLKQYVVCIEGSDPLIRWEMERGLDWTISSVAGESYRVDIDLSEALQTWAGTNFQIQTDRGSVKPVWKHTSFTLKYYSDALFDFPHWFGFSKRTFMLRLT